MDLDHVLNSLVAAGPTACVLGYCSVALWKANRDERARHLAEEDRNRVDFAATLEGQRLEFVAALKTEQDRHQRQEDDLVKEYIASLKSISSAVKGDPHA